MCWSRVGTKLCRAAALQELSLTPLVWMKLRYDAKFLRIQLKMIFLHTVILKQCLIVRKMERPRTHKSDQNTYYAQCGKSDRKHKFLIRFRLTVWTRLYCRVFQKTLSKLERVWKQVKCIKSFLKCVCFENWMNGLGNWAKWISYCVSNREKL